MAFTVRPLDAERWDDLDALFHAKGCSMARGCWCMYYRETAATALHSTDARRSAARDLSSSEPAIGLLAYEADAPVGWVALSPRTQYPRLVRSPVAKAVDEVPVWSLVCFVVPSPQRGRGVARTLLDAAVAYARARGAPALEAYPVDKEPPGAAAWLWNGAVSTYRKAGFVEVARRRPERPVMRRVFHGWGDDGHAGSDPRPVLLEHLHDEFGAWERLLGGLDDERLHAPRSGAGWSIRDVVGHLTGWQEVTLARLRATTIGGAPVFPAWRGDRSPRSAEALAAANDALHALHRQRPWPTVLAEWRTVGAATVTATARLPAQAVAAIGRFEGLPDHALATVIQASAIHHAGHRETVGRWLASNGGSSRSPCG